MGPHWPPVRVDTLAKVLSNLPIIFPTVFPLLPAVVIGRGDITLRSEGSYFTESHWPSWAAQDPHKQIGPPLRYAPRPVTPVIPP